MGPETALEYVRRAVWGMLYAHDACIVSQSPRGLKLMMVVIVKVCGAFGLTVSEKEDGDHADADTARTSNANHHQGSGSTLPPEIDRRICAGWMSFNRYRRSYTTARMHPYST